MVLTFADHFSGSLSDGNLSILTSQQDQCLIERGEKAEEKVSEWKRTGTIAGSRARLISFIFRELISHQSMPRPKVRPEDRQRSSKACLPCQVSKIRCDSQTPCTSCLRRDRTSACIYVESHRRRRPRTHRTHELRFAPFNHRAAGSPGSPRLRTSNEFATRNPEGNDDAEATQSVSEAPSVQSPECTESRLLLSSKGEKVYVGETSSLSFLQFLRGIMKQYMGPSAFTENGPLNIMLEADTNVNRNIAFEESLATKQELIQTYFQVCSGFFDLFDKDDIMRLLQIETSSSGRRINKEETAVLYLIIAIGGQCRGSNTSDFPYATKYSSMGQQYAFEGMLRDPSINMLRAFLLMAFYMLGACHRNAAYMYLGVASKAAAALGLHIGMQARGLSRDESKLRWRTYKSLRVFDLVVSFLLGRTTSSVPSNYNDLSWKEHSDSHSVAVSAAYNGSVLLEEIVQRLKKVNNSFDVPTAEGFLQRLRQWIQGLPRDFRQIPFDDEQEITSEVRETAIGNIHVSCIYYFAIILTTRSFLISHLMSRLKESSIITPDAISPLTGRAAEQKTSPQLAHVCISAATYMATMCEKAMVSDLLLRNMCIMKAWAFAAGLILGFSLFAYDDVESRTETESAFQSARHVLRYLANLSPQAMQYHEILTSFAEAIVKHRQQTSSARQRIADRYIDCVLDIGMTTSMSSIHHRRGRSTDRGEYPDTCEQLPQASAQMRSPIPEAGLVFNGNIERVEESDSDIPAGVDLDGFSVLPFDDAGSFSIDYEPFGLLLDGI
ncbi:C6 transcription factor, putative [Talaromyces stipitatus ATCC 10500]|uniref:C6 transcription factor, putative n=1 Tax=Talaromyces stipitatus (strain ATCC 10500 / CBS 375.48 / QM 6759 / NRRL 1006) TaxID=441959 RepID=B8LZK3_TALSN|nr:C6 transcription factor, putative [Talaromyces stipitatus ATCC 10500]EED22426.1 C6 transcription factor, putative [Talaromyces stipitatus ATCC 10500]